MRIFYTENKQTGQLFFSFLITLTKKQETKNGMNRILVYILGEYIWRILLRLNDFKENSLKSLGLELEQNIRISSSVYDCLPLCFQPVEGTVAFYLVYLLALDIR